MLVYERARKEARDLLDVLWDGTFPVKLAGITQALDAEVLMSPLASGLSGFVVKKEHEETANIVVNSTDLTERQRFTWAHELGHLLERTSVAGDKDFSFADTRFDDGQYDLHEFFADEFAGSLLMPASEIERLRADDRSEASMAAHFGVSLKALRKRLARLEKQPDAVAA